MPNSTTVTVFYAVKPLIPRRAQVVAPRIRARRILHRLGGDPLPRMPAQPLGFPWPDGAKAAAIVTHDVELDPRQHDVRALTRVEEQFDITSCWNFVVRRYRVDTALIAALRAEGHEVGVHGVYHDGKKYDSETERSTARMPCPGASGDHGASGIRLGRRRLPQSLSPLRPRDAQHGSVRVGLLDAGLGPISAEAGRLQQLCAIHAQRALCRAAGHAPAGLHTVRGAEVHRHRRGCKQIDFIHSIGGLINVIVHPDYMLTAARLELYRQLLAHLRDKDQLWLTSPSAVAHWTRERARAAEGTA